MSTENDTQERRCKELLIDYGFDNDVNDLPEIGKAIPIEKRYHHRTSIETIERDKLRIKREALFRSWLIENKPKNSVMIPIETNTTTGISDIFACYSGKSFWFECKSLMSPAPCYLRGTQYSFFKKLIDAGGHGKVITQYLDTRKYKPSSVYIFNAEDIICHPIDFFKQQGERLYFPKSIKARHIWHYNQKKEYDINYLYQLLFLDNEEIIW